MIEQVCVFAEVPRDELVEEIGAIVDRSGVAVVIGQYSLEEAMRVRRQVRNLLIPTIPLRATRVLAEHTLGRDRTPDSLQRRPIRIQRENTHRYFTRTVNRMLCEIDDLNDSLLNTAPLLSRFGRTTHRVSSVVLNRFAPNEEFERHQDLRSDTGLTYIIQTSPTLWHIHSLGPREGMAPLDFHTCAGDLVILAASNDNGVPSANRYAGFSDFDPNGSVIHSGENLTDKNRFTLALFSRPVRLAL